ncbi:MAG: hypothetical protein ACLUEQ_04140 [Cloacibacillus evryensis]
MKSGLPGKVHRLHRLPDAASCRAARLVVPWQAAGFTDGERDVFYKEVEDYCRPTLYDEKKGWTADYVRLRFLAVKPEE